MLVDHGDWETLLMLKKHIEKERKLNYTEDLERDIEHFNHFKNKVLVK